MRDPFYEENNIMAETELVNHIMAELTAAFPTVIRIWRGNTGAMLNDEGFTVRFGLTGSPAIVGIIKGGRFLGIEVKTPHGVQTGLQKDFQQMCADFNACYLLVRSVKEAKEQLAQYLRDMGWVLGDKGNG